MISLLLTVSQIKTIGTPRIDIYGEEANIIWFVTRMMNVLNKDNIFALAPFLTANDLIALASTCRHFGGGNHGVMSMIEEAAMSEVKRAKAEDIDWDRGGLLKRPASESWFAPYHRLVQLRIV